METKELIEVLNVLERNSNQRAERASKEYEEAVKFEEGYKKALWDVERLLTK